MSEVYNKVVKALSKASGMKGSRTIFISDLDYEDLKEELGSHEPEFDQERLITGVPGLWTPGSWLLQVPVKPRKGFQQGTVVLEVKTMEWF